MDALVWIGIGLMIVLGALAGWLKGYYYYELSLRYKSVIEALKESIQGSLVDRLLVVHGIDGEEERRTWKSTWKRWTKRARTFLRGRR